MHSAAREGPNICVGEDGKVPAEPAGCPLQYTRVVSEWRVSANDPNRADPASERRIFTKQWPGRKHNGGGLAFGPDGLLYIGLGDGGFVHGPSGADDAFQIAPALLFGDHLAQDLGTLFGKILRIDVDRTLPYAIPPDNPWVGRDGVPARSTPGAGATPFASPSTVVATARCTSAPPPKRCSKRPTRSTAGQLRLGRQGG